MRNCLTLISLLWLLGTVPCRADHVQQDSVRSCEYSLLMQVRGREITGICMMNIEPDGRIVGTIVNEFGLKAFDFTYHAGKTKIINAMGPLDKWYVKRVLRGDFAFILTHIALNKAAIKRKATGRRPQVGNEQSQACLDSAEREQTRPKVKDAVHRKRSIAVLPNGHVRMENHRYGISYTFIPMRE